MSTTEFRARDSHVRNRTARALIVLKVDTAARYQKLIDLLDDVRRAGRSAAHLEGDAYVEGSERFSVERMTPHDYKELGAL